jgi:hypothetical protein
LVLSIGWSNYPTSVPRSFEGQLHVNKRIMTTKNNANEKISSGQ